MADFTLHALGVVCGTAGGAALLWTAWARATAWEAIGVAIYVFGLAAMIGASALYHLANEPLRKERLRRLDHAAIYLMIAGTYTPFALLNRPERLSGWLLAGLWAIATVGVMVKLRWPRRGEMLKIALYLLMGWSIVLAIDWVRSWLSPAVQWLLLAGGVIYTAGVIFHLWQRMPYQNAAWHACVLAGATCHYLAIFLAITQPSAAAI